MNRIVPGDMVRLRSDTKISRPMWNAPLSTWADDVAITGHLAPNQFAFVLAIIDRDTLIMSQDRIGWIIYGCLRKVDV